MKTSTMVWTIIVILVALALAWYFFSQQSPVITTMPAASAPSSQTQTDATQSGTTTAAGSSTSASVAVSTGTAPLNATVTYDGQNFSPSTVTIAKGGTVTFTDTAGHMWVASDPHPVHNGYDGTTRQQHCAPGATPSFDQCQPGSSYSFTFDRVGSWGYHDHINYTSGGTVIVQ